MCLFVLGFTLAQEYSDDQTASEQQIAPNYAHQHYNPPEYVSILIIIQFKFIFKKQMSSYKCTQLLTF